MQPTLSPAENDPHDALEVAPDVVMVARAEEELSRLAREAKNRPATRLGQPKTAPSMTAPSMTPPSVTPPSASAPPTGQSPASRIDAVVAALEVPAVDTSFRAARTEEGPSMARRLGRGLAALLLAVCIGAAAVTWRASGEMIKQAIADWAPQFATKSSSPADASSQAAQDATSTPDAQQSAAAAPAAAQDNATPTAAASAAPSATASAAPGATVSDQTQLIQSMSRDLASLGQEVALLKASVAELKASNEQLAKVSEQNQKKTSGLAARAAVPPARKPVTTFRPTQASVAPMPPPAPYPPSQGPAPYPSSQGAYPPPAGAPYPPPGAAPYPPQTASVPPQAPGQSSDDPDIPPRPPMPVR
jgi:hypothetical protein